MRPRVYKTDFTYANRTSKHGWNLQIKQISVVLRNEFCIPVLISEDCSLPPLLPGCSGAPEIQADSSKMEVATQHSRPTMGRQAANPADAPVVLRDEEALCW